MVLSAAPQLHDAFDWLSGVWIPLAVGVASVVVAVAAFVASARATRIAESAEEGRALDVMRALAREDAQALTRWIAIATRPPIRFVHTRRLNEDPAPIPDGLNVDVARAEAESLLTASTVPGALQLWELTRFDLDHRYDELPQLTRGDDDSGEAREAVQERRETILESRDERMRRRIREWAADPVGQERPLFAERARLASNARAYQDGTPIFR